MRHIPFFLPAAALTFAATPALAQTVQAVDDVMTQIAGQSTRWEGVLRNLAITSFWILAGIEVAWAGFKLAFKGADFGDWLAEIVNQIFFLGFFYALLLNSVTWGHAIIDSFRLAASNAGGTAITPGTVLADGVKLAMRVLGQISLWDPSASAGLLISGVVIIIVYGLMCAQMVVTLAESYMAISAGVLNMAFGGSRWTHDVAIQAIKYAVSVGAKLMILQLILAAGIGIIDGFVAQFTAKDSAAVMAVIGASVVLLALTKSLPDAFQRIVGGASLAQGSSLIGAAAGTAAGTAGVLLGAAGVGGMAVNAMRLASAQGAAATATRAAASGGVPPSQSALGRAASWTGRAAGNMASSAARDVGRRLTGDIGVRHGSAPWRMAADLGTRRRLLNEQESRPQPPPAPSNDQNTIS